MKGRLQNLWRESRGLLLFLALMFVFRSVVADWNSVPTGSMLPTLVEGDRIWVDKMAYDLRLPFTHLSLLRTGEPQRGDIVVFDSARADKRMVKRVVGLPGDVVAMADNRLNINGQWLDYAADRSDVMREGSLVLEERLPGHSHPVFVRPAEQGPLRSFGPVAVPAGHYLVLGDNRDRSADSRVYGFIPRAEIVGRSRHVVLSLNYDDYYLPRKGRFLRPLM